jgi:hypothetical protein
MSKFQIDFFELAFLAEACIPPRPIARTGFWNDLTDRFWQQMTEGERIHLFEWLQLNYGYKDSLEKQEDTQIFHARFDPNNQFIVKTNYNNKEEDKRTFKMGDRYYIDSKSSIIEEYIVSVEKIVPNREY